MELHSIIDLAVSHPKLDSVFKKRTAEVLKVKEWEIRKANAYCSYIARLFDGDNLIVFIYLNIKDLIFSANFERLEHSKFTDKKGKLRMMHSRIEQTVKISVVGINLKEVGKLANTTSSWEIK